jgi:hypothetical protein
MMKGASTPLRVFDEMQSKLQSSAEYNKREEEDKIRWGKGAGEGI